MPIFDQQSRDQLRQMYVEAWRKRRERIPMEPLEAQVADVIELHPEYQQALTDPANVLDRDYQPEGGQSNPFLHMGLHLAVRDQIATDRPPGIRAAFEAVAQRVGSPHDAEHQVIECLAEALWEAQRAGRPPDEMQYLTRVRGLGRKRRRAPVDVALRLKSTGCRDVGLDSRRAPFPPTALDAKFRAPFRR